VVVAAAAASAKAVGWIGLHCCRDGSGGDMLLNLCIFMSVTKILIGFIHKQ
jgi:hypothetical protein